MLLSSVLVIDAGI